MTNGTSPLAEPFFIDARFGQRFCIYFGRARTEETGCAVLYVHPFAEEMNKARRMASLQARKLASAGHDVLLLDLLGCGDSAGDFGDATWDIWMEDVRVALEWLRRRSGRPTVLWGLRIGAALAAEAAAADENVRRMVLWNPVTNGASFMNQFLRMHLASQWLAKGEQGDVNRSDGTKFLRELLGRGEAVEVGGYRLNAEMFTDITRIELKNLSLRRNVAWLEVSDDERMSLLPRSESVVSSWREKGCAVSAEAIRGPAFWATAELSESPDLMARTVQALSAME